MRKNLALAVIACLALLVPAAGDASAATPRQRLANVVVPAYCDMPSQRLHHGATAAKFHPAQGQIEFGSAYRGVVYSAGPIAAHVSSGTQLLAQYTCTAGGVGWPSVLVLYNKRNALIGSLRLDKYAHAEHSQVTAWRSSGHHVVLRWKSYEGAGYDIVHHRSILSISDGKLRLTRA